MELRVLGCHGGETPKHRTSSFVIDGRIGLDAGAITSMMTLDEQKRLDAVLVSHAHMDHVRDLATLADTRCQQACKPLIVAAPAATIRALKKHFFNDVLWPDFSKIATRRGPTIEFVPLASNRTTVVAGMQVHAVPVSHTIDTSGFIVEDTTGTALVYSGDTGPTEKLWQAVAKHPNIRGVLLEVSFPNAEHAIAKVSGHHTPETLDRELDKLGERRRELPVLLYHIKPVFEARVERELGKLKAANLTIPRLGDRFAF